MTMEKIDVRKPINATDMDKKYREFLHEFDCEHYYKMDIYGTWWCENAEHQYFLSAYYRLSDLKYEISKLNIPDERVQDINANDLEIYMEELEKIIKEQGES